MVKTFLSILPRILEIKAEWDAREAMHDGAFIAKVTQAATEQAPVMAQEALRAHREWRVRFLTAISNREHMNAANIEADDGCKFGRWLHMQGTESFGHLPAYGACVAAHAEFHRQAGMVAQRINAGDYDAAKKMLSYGSDYQRASEELTRRVDVMVGSAASTPSDVSR
jgi:methyl-accepting chemotaxis protein